MDLSDRMTRDNGRVLVYGTSGVGYILSSLDDVDENLRTCNVQADVDLLLEARNYLRGALGV